MIFKEQGLHSFIESPGEKEIFKYNTLTESNVASLLNLKEMDFILNNNAKMLLIKLTLEIQSPILVLTNVKLKSDANITSQILFSLQIGSPSVQEGCP
jgi:hypothetical protein